MIKIITASLWGLDAEKVTVEADLHPGLPALNIVGLADATIKEAKERIRPAVLNSGVEFPAKRITVNLSPAGSRKEGSHFDLPIALAILMWQVSKQGKCLSIVKKDFSSENECRDTSRKDLYKKNDTEIKQQKDADNSTFGVMGELSLDGQVLPVRSALPLALGLRKTGIRKLILPVGNAEEVSIIKDIDIYPVEDLNGALEIYSGRNVGNCYIHVKRKHSEKAPQNDYSDVIGQELAKRALAIAATGGHGILLMGSPGVGKTMLASRLPGIMPDMDYEDSLELTKIYSVAGLLTEDEPVITKRPFIAPHNTVTKSALLGGGMKPGPGLISLAHRGVLFLDEFGEFNAKLLDLLRQPLEEGRIVISRGGRSAEFKCDFMLVAASNPCRCGYLGDDKHDCTCSVSQIESYKSRFSGPIIDRIDMHIQTVRVKDEYIQNAIRGKSYLQRDTYPSEKAKIKDITDTKSVTAAYGMSTTDMKRLVLKGRKRQKKRQGARLNAKLGVDELKEYCALGEAESLFMQAAYEQMALSLRSYHKIIKVARTIADMVESENIRCEHLAEALQYRDLTWLYR